MSTKQNEYSSASAPGDVAPGYPNQSSSGTISEFTELPVLLTPARSVTLKYLYK